MRKGPVMVVPLTGHKGIVLTNCDQALDLSAIKGALPSKVQAFWKSSTWPVFLQFFHHLLPLGRLIPVCALAKSLMLKQGLVFFYVFAPQSHFLKEEKARCLCQKDQSFRNIVSPDFWSGSVLGMNAKATPIQPLCHLTQRDATRLFPFKLLFLISVTTEQLIFTWLVVGS